MSTKNFYELLQYKRYAVSEFTDFLLVPEERIRETFEPDTITTKILTLMDQQLLHQPMIIPLMQWQVGNTVLAVHSYNVSSIALLIGYEYGLSNPELQTLMLAGVFHDVGKAFISDKIVDKNGRLAPTELSVMRQHPKIGKTFITKHYPEFGDDVINAVLMHHEKLDGSGYYKYSDEKISTYARIITVADIFCAVCEERVYHHARTIEESLSVLKNTKGLDDTYVKICCELVDRYIIKAKYVLI